MLVDIDQTSLASLQDNARLSIAEVFATSLSASEAQKPLADLACCTSRLKMIITA